MTSEARTPGVSPAEEKARLTQLLTDVAQLLSGWHQDGTAWTEWDESVYRRVGEELMRVDAHYVAAQVEALEGVAQLEYNGVVAVGQIHDALMRLRQSASAPEETE